MLLTHQTHRFILLYCRVRAKSPEFLVVSPLSSRSHRARTPFRNRLSGSTMRPLLAAVPSTILPAAPHSQRGFRRRCTGFLNIGLSIYFFSNKCTIHFNLSLNLKCRIATKASLCCPKLIYVKAKLYAALYSIALITSLGILYF